MRNSSLNHSMPGDISRPLGDLKGYQFWTIIGFFLVFGVRVALAFDVPMGVFGAKLFDVSTHAILVSDVLGAGLVVQANLDYRTFLNRSWGSDD